MSIRIADGKPQEVRYMEVGATSVVADTLVVTNAGVIEPATSPISDATLVGIALESVSASGGSCAVMFIADRELIADYTGSGKTSVATTDYGKVFDISNAGTVNLDDTSGGCFKCTGFDNDRDKIYGMIVEAKKEI